MNKQFRPKLLILHNLRMQLRRFNKLRKNLEGISHKVLTDSLRSMEEAGMITRTVYPEVPPKTEYSLNEPEKPCARFWMRYKHGEICIRAYKKPPLKCVCIEGAVIYFV